MCKMDEMFSSFCVTSVVFFIKDKSDSDFCKSNEESTDFFDRTKPFSHCNTIINLLFKVSVKISD